MGTENEELSREELRKKKRKKERVQALAIFGGAILAIILVIAILIGSIVHVVKNKKEQARELALQEELAKEATEEEYEAEAEEEIVVTEEASTESEEAVASEETLEEEEEVEEEEEPVASEPEEQLDATEVTEDVMELVDNQMSQMTIEQKVAQLFFVTPEQVMGRETPLCEVGSDFSEKINKYPIGGIVLKESNLKDAESLSSLTQNLKLMLGDKIMIGISEEGGSDSPFVKAAITENVMSSQQEIGESQGEAGAYSVGISIGSELRQYGLNLNFGPLGDVSTFGASIVANRSFGTDMETTKVLTKSVVQGLSDQGVISCVKYFPSYGDVAQSRGAGQLVSQRSKEDLKAEAEIYKSAIDAGAEFIMVSHVSLPKIRGDKRPASLSKEVITDIVRDEWGYDGVVITDYMDQPCIYQKYTYAEAAVGVIEAGGDMLLSTKNFEKSYNGILDAVKKGTLTEERIDESVKRILIVKYKHANL